MDQIGSRDSVSAGLSAWAVPSFPCSKCGRETTEHTVIAKIDNTDKEFGSVRAALLEGAVAVQERRICQNPECRAVSISSKQP